MNSIVDEGRRNKLKALKTCTYDLTAGKCTFFEADGTTPMIIIDGADGSVTDGTGTGNFLTDDVSTEINAIKTYAEYSLMLKSLKERNQPILNEMSVAIVNKINNSYIYSA